MKSTWQMEDRHKKILRKHRVLLRREISAEKLASELYSANIFDEEDLHEVNGERTPEQRADTLLDKITRRGPGAFSCFYQSLKNHRQDLAVQILTPFSGN